MLAVLDYGVNNTGSVVNMFRRLEVEVLHATRPADLERASAIVLPGIGAFDTAMTNLERAGLAPKIVERVRSGVPILGICLGMQLLGRGSDEGSKAGLGLIDATSRRFPESREFRVPNMGWTRTECLDPELFAGLVDARFYFVHSYHVVCASPEDVAARAVHGISFTAALRHGHVMGTQFHPEKSHRYGRKVLENFARMTDRG